LEFGDTFLLKDKIRNIPTKSGMEITKKEVEKLIGDKVLTYKVTKTYRGYTCTKVKIVATKIKDSQEITITLKPNN